MANFLVIFRGSQFLIKILSSFNNCKIPNYATRGFKFHLKFRVILLKESTESLRKVFRKQL